MEKTIPYHRPFQLDAVETDTTIWRRIKEIFNTGMMTNGKYVQKLEQTIKRYYDVDYCIATSSCTQALLLCVFYMRGKAQAIELSAFNWWSDLYILDLLNMPMFFDDIDKNTWLPNETYRSNVLSLYLHTFGNVGKSEYDNPIYDASHCMGAEFEDIGLATCISLAPTKLVTAGEGGLILTDNADLYNEVMELRDKVCRMPEINAVIGLQYFTHLKEILNKKKEIYNYYKKHIPGKFQEFNEGSSYNTIGVINTHRLTIPPWIETKQYYEPIKFGLTMTQYVYKNIICLPSFYNVDYKKVANDILEFNGLDIYDNCTMGEVNK